MTRKPGQSQGLFYKHRCDSFINIESVSMLIPKAASQRSHRIRVFSPCSKPICLPQGSPKTDFVFTTNLIFHIVSHKSDHLDQASHLKFVEFVQPFSHIVLLQFNPKPYKICFTVYLTTPPPQKKIVQKKFTYCAHSEGGDPREV